MNAPTSPVPASVVILSYNTRELTLDCLAHFAEPVLDRGWQVILVDNSTECKAPFWMQIHPQFPKSIS